MMAKRTEFGKKLLSLRCNPEEWDLPRNIFINI